MIFSLIINVFLNFFAPAAPFSPNWSAKVCGPLKGPVAGVLQIRVQLTLRLNVAADKTFMKKKQHKPLVS